MRTAAFAIAFTVGVLEASASCPNLCSGRGKCGQNDKCTCFNGFMGPDCAQRECPQAVAWVGGSGANTHEYVECSNKGKCDRSTGECQCFVGYEGSACDRSSCPNQCSGHGVCRFIEELGNYDDRNWDAGKIQGCSCDGGWSGDDCSQRICPVGDDPLTVPSSSAGATYRIDVVQDDSLTLVAADFHLEVTDLSGNTFSSRPIPLESLSPASAEQAILDIPAIRAIEGAVTMNGEAAFSFTLADPLRLGSVSVVTDGCTDAGCQPKHRTMDPAGVVVRGTVTATAPDALAESAECSNRGVCDSSTGLCACFSGYTGLACSTQTVLV